MTRDEFEKHWREAQSLVNLKINEYSGGDRASSPPAWLMKLDRHLMLLADAAINLPPIATPAPDPEKERADPRGEPEKVTMIVRHLLNVCDCETNGDCARAILWDLANPPKQPCAETCAAYRSLGEKWCDCALSATSATRETAEDVAFDGVVRPHCETEPFCDDCAATLSTPKDVKP